MENNFTPINSTINKKNHLVLRILLSLFILFVGLTFFIDFLIHIRYVANIFEGWIANGYQKSIYNLFFIDFNSDLESVRFLLSNFFSLILSSLFFYLGFKVIINLPKKRKLVIIIVILLLLDIGINYMIIQELAKRKIEDETNTRQILEKVDRKTVTNLSIIWLLKDPTLCKNVKTYNLLRNCMDGFNKSIFTTDYCAVLTNQYDRDQCVTDIATFTGNVNICDEISSDSAALKVNCKKAIQ